MRPLPSYEIPTESSFTLDLIRKSSVIKLTQKSLLCTSRKLWNLSKLRQAGYSKLSRYEWSNRIHCTYSALSTFICWLANARNLCHACARATEALVTRMTQVNFFKFYMHVFWILYVWLHFFNFKATCLLKIRKSNLYIAAFGQDICTVHASFK